MKGKKINKLKNIYEGVARATSLGQKPFWLMRVGEPRATPRALGEGVTCKWFFFSFLKDT
jgi:hypothetical protein